MQGYLKVREVGVYRSTTVMAVSSGVGEPARLGSEAKICISVLLSDAPTECWDDSESAFFLLIRGESV